MESLILFVVIFSGAAFTLAKSRGHNPWLWGALGVVLGPFAVLIVLLLKKGKDAEDRYH